MSYSSVSPARSPASPFGANIDSLPGQIALGHHCTRDGAHALQQRQVSAKPALALNPPTSLDDRVTSLFFADGREDGRLVTHPPPPRWPPSPFSGRPYGAVPRKT